jgi:putative SOS response-associated peptidase YedK
MCFHFSQIQSAETLSKRFGVDLKKNEAYATGRFNAFQYPRIPIIIREEPDVLYNGHWGLIPPHIHDIDYRKYTLNARIETLSSKPSFAAVTHNRCLIPVSAFFEWHWVDPKGTSKVPYEVSYPDNPVFAFAGLYSLWSHPTTSEIMITFTMVTTTANDLMAYVHNHKKRMPVVLLPSQESSWLNGGDISSFALCNPPLHAIPISP